MIGFIQKVLLAVFVAMSVSIAQPDPNFHIYIAYGQSNMSGPVQLLASDTGDARFKIFASQRCERLGREEVGSVYPAVPSLFDCRYGVSLAYWFGLDMVDSLPGVTVALIPVAVGGVSIKIFNKDTYADYFASLEDEDLRSRIAEYAEDGNIPQFMVDLGKKAQEVGVIKGVIFHQGESDPDDPTWPAMVKKTRDDLFEALGLSSDSVPFIAGEFLRSGVAYPGLVQELPNIMNNTYVASSEGLEGLDNYHFSRPSFIEFGRRYAELMLAAQRQKFDDFFVSIKPQRMVRYPIEIKEGCAYDVKGRQVRE